MDWRAVVVLFSLLYYADGFSKYGRTCKDIGCLRTEVCVLAEDPCTFGSSGNCGTYPTCKKASKVEGSHSEPAQPSAPKPMPNPQTPSRDFDSPPNYPPPAAPSSGGSSSHGGSSPYGGSLPYGGSSSNGGNSPYGGSSPYGGAGGGSPYGGAGGGSNPYGGSSPYGGNSPYGGSSPYGGNSPYGGSSSNGGHSPYGGGSPYGGAGGSSPYGGAGGGSPYGGTGGGSNPYGGNSHYGGSSGGFGTSGGKGSAIDSILSTIQKYASGGGGTGGTGSSSTGGSGLSNIFGNVISNLPKNGLDGLFNTRPIMENPNYSSYGSNSRSSNPQTYPSGYQPSYSQASQSRTYGQSNARHNAGATSKPSYGWNFGVTMVLTHLILQYMQSVTRHL